MTACTVATFGLQQGPAAHLLEVLDFREVRGHITPHLRMRSKAWAACQRRHGMVCWQACVMVWCAGMQSSWRNVQDETTSKAAAPRRGVSGRTSPTHEAYRVMQGVQACYSSTC